jgi:hypothetical protein
VFWLRAKEAVTRMRGLFRQQWAYVAGATLAAGLASATYQMLAEARDRQQFYFREARLPRNPKNLASHTNTNTSVTNAAARAPTIRPTSAHEADAFGS